MLEFLQKLDFRTCSLLRLTRPIIEYETRAWDKRKKITWSTDNLKTTKNRKKNIE